MQSVQRGWSRDCRFWRDESVCSGSWAHDSLSCTGRPIGLQLELHQPVAAGCSQSLNGRPLSSSVSSSSVGCRCCGCRSMGGGLSVNAAGVRHLGIESGQLGCQFGRLLECECHSCRHCCSPLHQGQRYNCKGKRASGGGSSGRWQLRIKGSHASTAACAGAGSGSARSRLRLLMGQSISCLCMCCLERMSWHSLCSRRHCDAGCGRCDGR